MINKLEKDEWLFLVCAIALAILIAIVVRLCYLSFEKDTNFYLSLIGTLVTIIALTFNIFQQMKLRKTAEMIRENTQHLYNNIRKEYHGLNFTRVISLTKEIEDSLSEPQPQIQTALVLIRQLQESLSECRKIYLYDGNNMEAIKALNKELSTHYVSLKTKSFANKNTTPSINNARNLIIRLRHYLTEIQPLPISLK